MSWSGNEPGGAFTRSSGSAVAPMIRGLKSGLSLASALVVESALHAQGIVASTKGTATYAAPSANRGLPGMNEAARLSRPGGQLPTPSNVIPAEQTGLVKSPRVDTGLVGAARVRLRSVATHYRPRASIDKVDYLFG